MSVAVPIIALSSESAVTASEADFALAMAAAVSGQQASVYEFCSNTACWIKQGKAWTITCATFANLAALDYMTVADDGGAPTAFMFDKLGTGVPPGYTQVDVSAASTNAQVAAALKVAIDLLYSATITTTDNTDGTLTLVRAGAQLALTEHVTHASFTVANSTALAATAGAGSMFVPALAIKFIDGKHGQTLSVIRDAADGKASLTPLRFVR